MFYEDLYFDQIDESIHDCFEDTDPNKIDWKNRYINKLNQEFEYDLRMRDAYNGVYLV